MAPGGPGDPVLRRLVARGRGPARRGSLGPRAYALPILGLSLRARRVPGRTRAPRAGDEPARCHVRARVGPAGEGSLVVRRVARRGPRGRRRSASLRIGRSHGRGVAGVLPEDRRQSRPDRRRSGIALCRTAARDRGEAGALSVVPVGGRCAALSLGSSRTQGASFFRRKKIFPRAREGKVRGSGSSSRPATRSRPRTRWAVPVSSLRTDERRRVVRGVRSSRSCRSRAAGECRSRARNTTSCSRGRRTGAASIRSEGASRDGSMSDVRTRPASPGRSVASDSASVSITGFAFARRLRVRLHVPPRPHRISCRGRPEELSPAVRPKFGFERGARASARP